MDAPRTDIRLEYERPVYVDRAFARVSRRKFAATLVFCAVDFICAIIVYRFEPRQQRWLAGLTALGGVVPLIALTFASAIATITQVFPDRLQIDLSVSGYRLRRYMLPFARIKDVVLHQGLPADKFNHAVFRRAPGLGVFMYFGKGICVKFLPGDEWWIGSNSAEQLFAAIEAARGAA